MWLSGLAHPRASIFIFSKRHNFFVIIEPFQRNRSPLLGRNPVTSGGDLWQTPLRSHLARPASLETPTLWAWMCPVLSCCDAEQSAWASLASVPLSWGRYQELKRTEYVKNVYT